jgi:hypothetical protein
MRGSRSSLDSTMRLQKEVSKVWRSDCPIHIGTRVAVVVTIFILVGGIDGIESSMMAFDADEGREFNAALAAYLKCVAPLTYCLCGCFDGL